MTSRVRESAFSPIIEIILRGLGIGARKCRGELPIAVVERKSLLIYGSGPPDMHARDRTCNDEALDFTGPLEDRVAIRVCPGQTERDSKIPAEVNYLVTSITGGASVHRLLKSRTAAPSKLPYSR